MVKSVSFAFLLRSTCFSAVICLSSASMFRENQDYESKTCSGASNMEKLNTTKLMNPGKWYMPSGCGSIEYVANGENNFKMTFTQPNKTGFGFILANQINFSMDNKMYSQFVVSTDYENYAILYSCGKDRIGISELAWLLLRAETEITYDNATAILAEHGHSWMNELLDTGVICISSSEHSTGSTVEASTEAPKTSTAAIETSTRATETSRGGIETTETSTKTITDVTKSTTTSTESPSTDYSTDEGSSLTTTESDETKTCHNVHNMNGLNITQLMNPGKWHMPHGCGSVEYFPRGEYAFQMAFNDSDSKYLGAVGSNNILLLLNNKTYQQTIVSTDYTNYAILYSCHSDRLGISEFIWFLFRRETELGNEQAIEILAQYGKAWMKGLLDNGMICISSPNPTAAGTESTTKATESPITEISTDQESSSTTTVKPERINGFHIPNSNLTFYFLSQVSSHMPPAKTNIL